MKEASATKTALNSGVKTYKQVAAENGMDWRSQIDDMAEVLEYGKSKGIDLGGVLFDGKLQEEKEDDKETTDTGGGGGDTGQGAEDTGGSEADGGRDGDVPGNAAADGGAGQG